jgi:hypothetical protein
MLNKIRLRSAFKAASIHLMSCLAVALLAGMLVFLVWYPYPYRELSGGRELFLLIVIVDVICGPLLTAVIFNPSKSRSELFKDLTFVIAIQICALGYGLYTMAMARPVYLVHEVDRLKVVSAADIPVEQLLPKKNSLYELPWFGPRVIGTREPKDADEKLKSLDMSLQGQEPSVRPDWWQAYELSRAKVLERAKPVSDLRKKQSDAASKINRAVVESGRAEAELVWLPMTSFKSSDWVVFLDAKTAMPLAYGPIDGF